MILRHRHFEHALNERVKAHDAALQLSRWQKVGHFLYNLPFVSPDAVLLGIRSGITLVGLCLVWYQRCNIYAAPESACVLLALWFLGAACFSIVMIEGLESETHQRQGNGEFSFRLYRVLPVSLENVIRFFVRKWGLWNIFFFVECLGVYTVFFINQKTDLILWIMAILCSLLQCMLFSAFVFLRVSLGKRYSVLWRIWGLGILVLVLMLLYAGDNGARFVGRLICLYIPMGWGSVLFVEGGLQNNMSAYYVILPCLGLIATLWHSVSGVKSRYLKGELCHVYGSRYASFGMPVDETVKLPVDEKRPLAGAFSEPDWHQCGWAGRCLRAVLTQDEKIVAEGLRVNDRRLTLVVCWIALSIFVYSIVASIFFHGMVVGWLIDFTRHHMGIVCLGGLVLMASSASIILNTIMTVAAYSSMASEPSPFRYRGTRLFPVSHWMNSVVSLKVSLTMGLLILPLMFWLDQMPGFNDVNHKIAIHLLWTKSFLTFWVIRLIVSTWALQFCGCEFWSWRLWKELLKTALAYGVLMTLVGFMYDSNDLTLEPCLAMAVVGAAFAWYVRCGAAYLELPWDKVVKSVFNR
jgi:hypothetical protein